MFDDYVAARERYLERLRIDSEIRRLERAWGLSERGGPGLSVGGRLPDALGPTGL